MWSSSLSWQEESRYTNGVTPSSFLLGLNAGRFGCLVSARVEGGFEAGCVLLGVNIDVGGCNLGSATDFQLAHEVGGWSTQGAASCVLFQACASVSDIQVPHGPLADAI